MAGITLDLFTKTTTLDTFIDNDYVVMSPVELDTNPIYTEVGSPPLTPEHTTNTEKYINGMIDEAMKVLLGLDAALVNVIFFKHNQTNKLLSLKQQVLLFIMCFCKRYGYDKYTNILACTPNGDPMLLVLKNAKYDEEVLKRMKNKFKIETIVHH